MIAGRGSRFRAGVIAGVPIIAIILAAVTPSAQADVDTVAGSAYGASVESSLLGTVIAPTPSVSGSATEPTDTYGPIAQSAVPLSVPGLVSLGVLNASTEGGGVAADEPAGHLGFAQSRASVVDVVVGLGSLTLDAIETQCTSDGNGSSGFTEIVGGVLGGNPILGSPAANTAITLPGILEVVLNEQDIDNAVGSTSITVRGAHITLLPGLGSLVGVVEIILAESHCEATGPDVNVVPTTSTSTTVPPSTTSTTTTAPPSTTTTTTTAPPSTTTTTTAPPQSCNTSTTSGGDGTTVTNHELGQAGPTSFRFDYETFSQPDRITIRYQGTTVFDVGPVGTNGTVTTTVNLPAGTSTQIEVTVIGGGAGTAWNYTVFCPGSGGTTTTSTTTTTLAPGTTTTTRAPGTTTTTAAPGTTTTIRSTTTTVVATTTTAAPATTVAPTATTTTSTTIAPVVTVPPVQPTTTAATTTTRAPTVAAPPLPRTGGNMLPLVALGMLAIALGAVVRRSEQAFTPVVSTPATPPAAPVTPEFRALETPPAVSRNRGALSPLDPATADALSALEPDDPDPGGG